MALSARARGTGMVVDVHIWRGSLFGAAAAAIMGNGGIGHAIATGYRNPHLIFVNMWPNQPSKKPWSPKSNVVVDTYSGTVRDYKRLADVVYSIYVPKGNVFTVAAMDHRNRPYWDSYPSNSKSETNCSYSVWDCLTRGGVNIGSIPLDPTDLRTAIVFNTELVNGIRKSRW
jgi:hypothetical protein